MRKKILKPFLIVSASLAAALGYYSYTKACADVGWEDWYNSLFAPEMVSEKGKEPFFRSMMQFYKSDYYYDNVSLFNEVNLDEWYAFFNHQVNRNDLQTLLYNTTVGQIDTAIFRLRNAAYPLTENLKGNSLFGYANATDAKDFLFYVGYARRCEPYATYNPYGWYGDGDEWRADASAMEKLVEGGNKMIGLVKNAFIKERYVFQVLRLKFLQNDYTGVVDYYTQHKNLLTGHNTMQYRCQGYLAGAYLRLGQVAEANLLYAQLFDRCEPMRVAAFQSFNPRDESDWDQTLELATSARDKCAVWQLLGLKHDALRACKEIYAIDPYSDKTELLLSRLVNMAEEQFLPSLSYYYNHYRPDTTANNYSFGSQTIDEATLRFINQVAASGKSSNPLLWQLSAGYLQLAKGNHQAANGYFAKVRQNAAATGLMKDQARLLQLVCTVDETEKLSPDFENTAARELKWLSSIPTDGALRTSYAYNWCRQRLAFKYMAQKQTIKAQLLHNLTHYYFYLDEANCQRMKAFFDKPDKTAFEKYLAEQYPHAKSDIIELEAIKLFYANRLDEAVQKLAEDPGCAQGQLYGDPFRIRINDCHDCDHTEATDDVIYSKREFIVKMCEYKKLAQQNPKEAAHYYFLMANGFYNATYFGNARRFYENPLVDFGTNAYWYRDFSALHPFVLDCKTALDFYQKALDSSSKKEFKAQCCFMAAKCEQNQVFTSGTLGHGDDFRAGNYFALLEKEYSKTNYYKEVIHECGYFRTYLAK